MGGAKAHYDCIKAFSETDFTEDLKKIDVPVLVMHGDDDQIVPYRRLRAAVGQAAQERHAQGLQGLPARHVHDACRRHQPGPARLHQGLRSKRNSFGKSWLGEFQAAVTDTIVQIDPTAWTFDILSSKRSAETPHEHDYSRTQSIRRSTPRCAVDLKLEVVVIPVSDVDRARSFYGGLGWRLDADFVNGDGFRVVQFTPPGRRPWIHVGKGLTPAAPGSAQLLYLVVSDIEAARADLVARGADVSEIFPASRSAGPAPAAVTRRAYLRLVRHVQRSRRRQLAAPGSQRRGCPDGSTPRPRVLVVDRAATR